MKGSFFQKLLLASAAIIFSAISADAKGQIVKATSPARNVAADITPFMQSRHVIDAILGELAVQDGTSSEITSVRGNSKTGIYKVDLTDPSGNCVPHVFQVEFDKNLNPSVHPKEAGFAECSK